MTLRSAVGPLVLAVALAGCATAVPYDPYQIPEPQFREKVRRIALAPIVVPPQLGVAEPAKLAFDALIEAKLREAGFATYPAKEWGEVFGRVQKEAGGVFDPNTGRPDDAKIKLIWEKTAAEVRNRFQLDAVLLPRVQVVNADWRSASANWDGVSEMLASGMGLLGAPNAFGTMPALSLVVSIGAGDSEATAYYRHRGGIQVLEKLTPISERFSGKIFAPVPPEQLLADAERNRGAVDVALGPLLKKP
jgi:hypothetical protein